MALVQATQTNGTGRRRTGPTKGCAAAVAEGMDLGRTALPNRCRRYNILIDQAYEHVTAINGDVMSKVTLDGLLLVLTYCRSCFSCNLRQWKEGGLTMLKNTEAWCYLGVQDVPH